MEFANLALKRHRLHGPLGANHSCKILFDNHILAMTRAMSNSDCNHPMIGPNEPLVQMNCLRGSLWSSEHWFEINCRSSHTQDIFTVICRVENIQDPSIVRQIFPWKYSSMKRALKMIWQTIETHCEQIHGKKPLLKGGWGRACACLANCKTEITPRCICDIFDDTSCAVCDILDVYDISCAVCVYCATQSADI